MSSNSTEKSSSSGEGDPLIRNASSVDIPVLAALLGRAFYHDPLLRWIFPKDEIRSKGIDRHFSRLLKPRIGRGVVTTINSKSVAVWTPPNPPVQSLLERYSESFHMRRAHGQIRNCFQRMAERHPPFPHWYLLALATDDTCRGQGLAGLLLEDMFRRCDRDSQKVVLETSTESNLAYYKKFGFVVTDELLIGDGVKSWLMCRGT